jgi:hypothetical protein
VYQVPIAVDIPLYRRTGPRDFIVKVMNAVNSDGSRKYLLDLQLQTLVTNIRFDATGARPKAVGVDYLSGRACIVPILALRMALKELRAASTPHVRPLSQRGRLTHPRS